MPIISTGYGIRLNFYTDYMVGVSGFSLRYSIVSMVTSTMNATVVDTTTTTTTISTTSTSTTTTSTTTTAPPTTTTSTDVSSSLAIPSTSTVSLQNYIQQFLKQLLVSLSLNELIQRYLFNTLINFPK